MKRGLSLSLFLLYFVISLNGAIAQVWNNTLVKGLRPENYAIKTYTTNDGLPSKNTTAALKDRRGFMWIGTENGLCKFDGYTFKTFVNIPGDPTSITNNYINALIEDQRGRIWVGTMDGLNLLNPLTEKFSRFYHGEGITGSISNNKIWSVLADQEGLIWIGTDDGFNQFVEKNHSFIVYQPDTSNRYAMKGKSVNAIVEDRFHTLWLGNWSSGLNSFNKTTRHFTNYIQPHRSGEKNPNDVWNLCTDDQGMIWVGTYWKGLFQFNPATGKFTALKCPDPGNTAVFTVKKAGKNLLVAGGNAGFYWINTMHNTWTKLPELANNPFGDTYTDQNGLIWICGSDGLTKIDYKQYKFELLRLSLGQKIVKSIVLKDSVLWLGTNNGLYQFDYKNGSSRLFLHTSDSKSLASNEISKLYLDSEGTIWILTENGFDQYSESTGNFIHHYHHSSIGNLFNEDVFRDMVELSLGEYALATDAGLKIYHSRSNTFTHYYNNKKDSYSINNNHLYSLLKDADNAVWIGTYGGGLNRFDPVKKRFTVYTNNEKNKGSISNNIVRDLYLDSKHTIWVCTPDGLNKYLKKSNSFQVYTKKHGFSSNVFNEITEDNKGNMWVLTENGITTFNPTTMAIKNFDEADGVYSSTTMCKAPDGSIYLAGKQGLVYFDPLRIKYNKQLPPVYFSDFQIFNKSVLPGKNSPLKQALNSVKEITLSHDQSVFSFEFVALNYTHSEKNEYAYKLVGFDEKWNYVGKQRKATYTNLNPGRYVLWVKASNNDGLWNTAGRKLVLIITPPWFQTWWAYLIYMSIIGGLIYAYILYRDRQAQLRYKIKVAHIEAEKEKELNERKLSFFTNISHEFRTPLTLIINPVKELLYKDDKNVDTTNLNIVYRNAKRLLSLVDQLLLFRKADLKVDKLKVSKLNLVNLSKEVFLCFSHQAKSKDINFVFSSILTLIDVYADREKLEIVLFNLLSNAIKFTPEHGSVNFSLREDSGVIHIEIKDTGCGIPESTGEKLYNRFYQEPGSNDSLKGGFGIGLFIVRNFIESHGGSISYVSKEREGTTFRIQLLKGKTHLNPELILDDLDDLETSSVFLKELIEDEISANAIVEAADETFFNEELTSDMKRMLIIDDNKDIREYLKQLFKLEYKLYEADNGHDGLQLIKEFVPDIVLCDVMMPGMSGIELCSVTKEDITLSHIPFILLTASSSSEIKLKGIEGGADDYISKPFDKEILIARVTSILKSKNNLQKYFYNEITLNAHNLKISNEYKDFLDSCILIVEKHLIDPEFNIQVLAEEIGMSRSKLYKKIKSISGQSSNSFIRFIRLRKAAEIFINTDNTILETSYLVGINDSKYFREQFNKLFNMNPSQYIKKYRKTFSNNLSLNQDLMRFK
ncbi:hybrid sensor histidine kinase/response regulator transcription factor [Arcticibacter eurypsychrophilus]|uniref:hybrid sensor histidine kinase/response regulator transcription factor n=1 Tax=Arcticibacter eurypsychrophilus TaxID=1434752 RepID=UPI00084CE829|nr:two-component regulator propeller domain-containing protein [Arcticibacter eurypsychrophilus]